jgi:hypothetical protein
MIRAAATEPTRRFSIKFGDKDGLDFLAAPNEEEHEAEEAGGEEDVEDVRHRVVLVAGSIGFIPRD